MDPDGSTAVMLERFYCDGQCGTARGVLVEDDRVLPTANFIPEQKPHLKDLSDLYGYYEYE